MASVIRPSSERVWALFIALLLGYYSVVSPVHQIWRDHWLLKDRQQGTGMVIKEHWAGHGIIVYEYRVAQNVYTGQDRRNRRDPKSAFVMPGEKTDVYYSASHPWISALNPSDYVRIDGLPVIAFVWLIEVCLLTTVFKPESKWALNSTRRQEQRSAVVSSPRREGLADLAMLIGYAILIVLGMAAVEIGVNFIFGRR